LDDRFDAFVLADTLRTDRARLRPLAPNSPATVALHGLCRARSVNAIASLRMRGCSISSDALTPQLAT
jgi:hypothetical protein